MFYGYTGVREDFTKLRLVEFRLVPQLIGASVTLRPNEVGVMLNCLGTGPLLVNGTSIDLCNGNLMPLVFTNFVEPTGLVFNQKNVQYVVFTYD